MSTVVDIQHALPHDHAEAALISPPVSARAVFDRTPAVAPGLSFYAPLALVVLALALLAVLPLIEQRRIAARLDEIAQVLDPARIAVGDMQIALALEAAGTRGFLLTGNQQYAASHQAARLDRKSAYERLRELSPSLEPAHSATITAIGAVLRDADTLLDQFFAGRITREGYMTQLASQQARFVATIADTTRLQRDLRAAAAARRNEIHDIHKRGSYLALLGVCVALAAVVSVARLSARHRALAASERASRDEAENARAEAERRRQETDRIAASRAGLMRGFSHDVKNALAAADGYLFMLEEGVMTPLNARHRGGVEKARRSVATAGQLIEDLLEFARAEAPEMALHSRATDLRQLVPGVVDDYRAQAAVNGLALEIDVPADFPIVETDADRVVQILSNLISNAVKYTSTGGVTVRAAIRDDDRGRSCAVVDVVDSGPGIPEPAQPIIFDEFRRLDAASGRRGTGIGLAISRRIAGALGGRVTLESASGRGSTFTLWLPLDQASA